MAGWPGSRAPRAPFASKSRKTVPVIVSGADVGAAGAWSDAGRAADWRATDPTTNVAVPATISAFPTNRALSRVPAVLRTDFDFNDKTAPKRHATLQRRRSFCPIGAGSCQVKQDPPLPICAEQSSHRVWLLG